MSGLTRRAVVLGKIQSAVGSPAVPVPALNGLLVSDMGYSVDGQVIERNFLRDSLSALPHRMGRKLFVANFSFELKAGPVAGARPEWSPLMRAAGMEETLTRAAPTSARTVLLMWTASAAGGTGVFYCQLAATGNPTISEPVVVMESGEDMKRATVVAGLPAGSWWYGDGDTLGYSTIYVHLSDGLDPDTKAQDFIQYCATGTSVGYKFRDTSFEYGTFYLYPDGLLLQCQDALVDVTGIQFNAGATAIVSATLRSKYVTPTDVTIPTGVLYHTNLPPLAESMAFTLDSYALGTIPSFSVNFGNTIGERLDLNSAHGFKGSRITGRAPTGQLSIEQELVATFAFFSKWENATEMAWSMTMGSAGSRLNFSGPAVQISSIAAADIAGGRGFNVGLKFTAPGATKEFNLLLD